MVEEERIEEVLLRKKSEFLSQCKVCGGVGFVGGSACECLREFRVWNRLLRRGFPEEYLDLSLDVVLRNVSMSDEDRRLLDWYVSNFAYVRERGLSLYIWGSVGVGKTGLAVVIAKEYARWCLSDERYIWDFSAFYSDLSAFFEAREDSEEGSWNADLYVLDEFGRDILGQDVRDWLVRRLERFVRFRVAQRKVTILVSNLEPSRIAGSYGEGMASVIGVVGDNVDGIAYRSIHLLGSDLRRNVRFSRWLR
jgi:DNA replication protein DnaC